MKGIDPRLIVLFCIMFIALGIYNVLLGRRRMRQAQMQGNTVPWYKQISILTGIEYVLLALAFLLNIGISYGWLPKSLNPIIFPAYLVVLIASGLLAGIVIYQGITASRARRRAGIAQAVARAKPSAATRAIDEDGEQDIMGEERAELAKKRRDRRQKAAAARRRRMGRA